MTQWGSKSLGDQGYSFDQILEYYYGNDIEYHRAPIISGVPSSDPGYDLNINSRGGDVKTIQKQLNGISKGYPAVAKLDEDGIAIQCSYIVFYKKIIVEKFILFLLHI
ncbi:hypothetical protein [Romboutsia sp.]|uniref:hypothetical protein n=1 Tax=Romboutsia sp. TaxID=1965302 RepID=UPI003F3CEA09